MSQVYPNGSSHEERTEWEHVKWAFKATVLAGATVKDHLVGVHFMASNFLTTSSIDNLRDSHPIRVMLRPHT